MFATVSGDDWLAGSTVTVEVFSPVFSGTANVDAGGSFSISVAVSEIGLGAHTARVSGLDANGEPAVLTDDFFCGAAGSPPPVAVTGGNLLPWLLVLGGLVLAGGGAVAVGRRRARRLG